MRKGAQHLYAIENRVKDIKHFCRKLGNDEKEHDYDQLTKEAGGLYTLLRKLKRDKKIVF